MGHVAPEDGTIQIAIKTGVDDQFAGLSGHFFLRVGIKGPYLLIV